VNKLLGLGILVLIGVLCWNYWPSSGSSNSVTTPDFTPAQTWISPGKYKVEGFHPGATASIPIALHNGNDEDTTFEVTARVPDNLKDGYEPWPWPESVIIEIPEPTLGPGEMIPIPIELTMPEDVEYEDKLAEVWVSVIEQGQEGMVITELVTRVLIETR